MGSERLPGKVLLPLYDDEHSTILDQIVNVLLRAASVRNIVLATSTADANDQLELWAANRGIVCYRGSEDDVLSRFCTVAEREQFDQVVRLTGDNPFISHRYISATLTAHMRSGADYTYSTGLPLGMNVEVVSSQSLMVAAVEGTTSANREHVTHYVRSHPAKFQLHTEELVHPGLPAALRLTIDTEEDYQLARALFALQRRTQLAMDVDFLAHTYATHTELFALNELVPQKKPT